MSVLLDNYVTGDETKKKRKKIIGFQERSLLSFDRKS